MTKERNVSLNHDDHITSVGDRLRNVPEFARHDVEWMEGVHGSAKEDLPSQTDVPTPDVLNSLPWLHPDRPRGSKAMIDVHGANYRLQNCRPGAWLTSSFTGWKWAVWPGGQIGWLPNDVELPKSLTVANRNDVQ